MNSHKVNMYVGTIIGALLVFLLLGFFSELIFVGRGPDEHAALAFAVEIEEDAGDTEEAAVDVAALIAAADVARGERLFGRCKACHKLTDGANGVGPFLWGVVGRQIGTAPGYNFSTEMANHGGNWSLDNLLGFLEAPKKWAPGTKMSFAGIKKPGQRADLIAHLRGLSDNPAALPK